MLKIEYLDGALVKKMFFGAANSLERNKESINSLNVFPVPDGDTGTNMSLTMQSALKQLKAVDDDNIEKIAQAISNGSLMGARGNSGVILSQLFRGFSKNLKDVEKIDTVILANILKSGSDTAYRAVMKPIEGTILTVARECAEKALELSKHEKDMKVFLEKVIKHGDAALQRTPDLLPVLKQAGVVDAGGKGFLMILVGAFEALIGKDEQIIIESNNDEPKFDFRHQDNDTEIEFGYCTEFIINDANNNKEVFRDTISSLGDSMLVVGGEGIIKVHIHTNDPGQVLQEALKLGELIDIKIDNMRYQHQTKIVNRQNEDRLEEVKKYSFITVAMGEGIKNVFSDIRVDYVISGGQTMNPSTEDILNAINEVKGENIIILPNNSNIILAATQAKELSDKKVEVIPTKTIPQGISAMLAFDEESELDDNIYNMLNATKEVKTGQVTYAVRDTVFDDIEIKKDDIIGIYDGIISTVGGNINQVSLDLLEKIIDEKDELITIFYGEGISKEQINEFSKLVETQMPDMDVEIVYGGQPLYYYIFSIE